MLTGQSDGGIFLRRSFLFLNDRRSCQVDIKSGQHGSITQSHTHVQVHMYVSVCGGQRSTSVIRMCMWTCMCLYVEARDQHQSYTCACEHACVCMWRPEVNISYAHVQVYMHVSVCGGQRSTSVIHMCMCTCMCLYVEARDQHQLYTCACAHACVCMWRPEVNISYAHVQVYMHVSVCGGQRSTSVIHMCMCTCLCLYVEARGQYQVFPSSSLHLSFEARSPLNPGTHWFSLTVAQRASGTLLSLGTKVHTASPSFLMWVLGSRLSSSCFCDTHFTNRATSVAPLWIFWGDNLITESLALSPISVLLPFLPSWPVGRLACGEAGLWGGWPVGRLACGEAGLWGGWYTSLEVSLLCLWL
jgi:hypothetical protein